METRPWRPGTKIAFRFVFIYFLLFSIYVPAQFIPIRPFQILFNRYDLMWHEIAIWVGVHFLGMQPMFKTFVENPSGGSHDTATYYVETLCYFVVAVIGTVLWSIFDRKRANYAYLHAWFMVYLRLIVAVAMINFGAVKIFPAQFPPPTLSTLLERYGNASPMGLLWTFMGASQTYTLFSGAVELLGGVLLLFPTLATLGGLVTIGALTNVLMLNFGYDVPVKLATINWLIMAGLIVAPDLERLADVLVFHRMVPATSILPLFRRRWLNVTALAIQVAFGLAFLAYRVNRGHEVVAEITRQRQAAPLYGIWTVDEFSINGASGAALWNDPRVWHRLVVDSATDGVIEAVSGPDRAIALQFDSRMNQLTMANAASNWSGSFSYDDRVAGKLVLRGQVDGSPVVATLHREGESQFSLLNHKFRWIQATSDRH